MHPRNTHPESERPERRIHARARSTLQDGLRAWGPAIVWAALIFYLSTDEFSSQNTSRVLAPILNWLDPAMTQDQLDVINALIRKCAHFVEYFIFYVLVYRGLSRRRPGWRWSRGLGAWLVVVAYSALDELHQAFVLSRTASPWDSLLDSTGAFAAMLAVFVIVDLLSSRRTT